MIKFKNKKINNESGFTIMETLAAIFILLISITGPMVFAQNSLRAAFQSRDQITAFYLAQDAIEYVKNRRDHIALSGDQGEDDSWLGNLNGLCKISGPNKGCSIDTYGNAVKICNPSNHPGCIRDLNDDIPLKINSYGHFGHGHTGSTDSIFYRAIYIKEIVEDVEAEVVVKVRWTSHDSIGMREIIVAEHIYNWPTALGF